MKMTDFGFHRGVDLGGWLSQCDYSQERMDTFVTEADFDTIAAWGLDHVRIPVDYNVFENEDGSYREEGFARVAQAIAWAKKRGLKVVLDLHKTSGFSFDADEKEEGFFSNPVYQERFYRLWEAFATRYCDPENVAFELLNEVTDQGFLEAWKAISAECIRRIRRIAPRSLILLGSYWNNSASAVKDLNPPPDDRVIYNFHCYEPLAFTHQGAGWVPSLDRNARVSFDQTDVTPAYFESLFQSAIETAEKNHTCLYCGEYGVIDTVSPEDTLSWYKAIHEVLEKHQIARAAWNWRSMNFGLSESRLDSVRDELLKVL